MHVKKIEHKIMKNNIILGVDIGGSGMKAALVDITTGKMTTERYRIPTPQPATPQAMTKVFKRLVDHFEWTGAVGCGFPAVVQQGVVHTATNIDKTWVNTPIVDLFTQATGLPVTVINDADAAGIAELKFGEGKGQNGVVLLLTIGTGIGSALFINGQLVPNTEFGVIEFKGGMAERYASSAVRDRLQLNYDEWGIRFAEYLYYIDRIINPDFIILGGGISKKHHKFFHHFTVDTPVVPAQLRNHAGIIGAAMAAQDLATGANSSNG